MCGTMSPDDFVSFDDKELQLDILSTSAFDRHGERQQHQQQTAAVEDSLLVLSIVIALALLTFFGTLTIFVATSDRTRDYGDAFNSSLELRLVAARRQGFAE